MSGLDIAKALTEVDDSKFARVTYGVAQTDSGDDYTDDDGNVIAGDENYVFVLLDGHTEVSKLRCDCYVRSGYRVKVVGDPSGRYLLYSMAGQVEELETEDANLQKQIDAIEDTKVKQTSSNDGHAHPILLKYTANADDDTANDETAGARYKNNVVINPSESAIRATDYYINTDSNGNDLGQFHGNASSSSKWKSSIQLTTTAGSVVTGTSDSIDGSGNANWQLLFSGNGIGSGLSYDGDSHYISLGSHAESTGAYGVGNDSNYGHLKISDSPSESKDTALSSAGASLIANDVNEANKAAASAEDTAQSAKKSAEEAQETADEALNQISSIEERTKRGVAQIVIYPLGDNANNLTDYTLESYSNYGSGIVIDRNANTYYVEPGYVAIQASCVASAEISEAKTAHFQLTRYSAESGTTLGNVAIAYAAALVSDEYGSKGSGTAVPITPMQILQLTENTVFSLNSFDGTLCATNRPYRIYIQYWKEI